MATDKSKEAMKLALEALENSVDLVSQEARNAEELYGKYPTRLARIQGLVAFEVAHEKAITALREALAEQPAQQEPVAVELVGVENAIKEGDGFWKPCTGCYETNEGHPPTGAFFSPVFKCHMGHGCSECGGIGAIWDDTDYEAMADHMMRDDAAPQPAQQEPVAYLHQCSKKPELKELSFKKNEPSLSSKGYKAVPLNYTSPPAQRTWVGLSEEEIESIFNNWPTYHLDHEDFARAIEAKLREKNS